MQQTMMALGEFRFSIDTAAYEEFDRRSEYRHEPVNRQGRAPVLHFGGPGRDTITLAARIFPRYRGGLGQLDRLREMAGRGEPMELVDGLGFARGLWCLTRVEEGQRHIDGQGVAARIDVGLTLEAYGEALT